MGTQSNQLQETLSAYTPANFTTIIDRLAGGKDNLRIELQNVEFIVKNKKIELNGTVNFNVIHKIQNAHVAITEKLKNG